MRYLFLFAFSVLAVAVPAQTPQWLNYSTDYIVSHLAFEGDFVWASTQGGLIRFDRTTGAKQIFQPWNSGLTGLSVNEVLVDPDGTKWIGSEEGGLSRWDGADDWQRFDDINTGDTLIDIYKLTRDAQGNLWFISRVNGTCWGCNKLFRFDGTNFTMVFDLHTANYVRDFAIAADGTVWLINTTFIYRIENDQIVQSYDMSNSVLVEDERLRNIEIDQAGNVYVATNQYLDDGDLSRLLRFDGNAWTAEETLDGETIGDPQDFFQDPAGNLWLQAQLTHDGTTDPPVFFKFDGTAWTALEGPEYDLSQVGSDYLISSNVDAEGHLWTVAYVENNPNQVFEYDWNSWKSHDTEIFPLLSNYMSDIAFDKQQNTWFAGFELLTRFDGVAWYSYGPEDFDLDADYFDIAALTVDDSNGDLWIAFNDNNNDPTAFARFDGTHFTTYQTPSEYDAFEVCPGPNGILWVASAADGLGRFDGSSWIWYNESNSPLSNSVHNIEFDPTGTLWLGSDNGVVRFDGTNWTVFNTSNAPLRYDHVYLLFVDQSGTVWAEGIDGLARYADGAWQSITVPGHDEQSYFYVSDIVEDFDHSYWVATSNRVLHWDGGSNWTGFDMSDYPMGEMSARRIRIDPYGNKWFVHNAGATVFNADGISNQFVNPSAEVRGQVFFDENQDGQLVAGEPGIPGEKLLLLPDSVTVFTALGGYYTFFPTPGQHTVQFEVPGDFDLTSASNSYDLTVGDLSVPGPDFGIWTANPPDSLQLEASLGFLRCNGGTPLWIYLTNLGLADASGTITVEYDSALTFLEAVPAPASQNGNTLTWAYTDLSFLNTLSINLSFGVPGSAAAGQFLSLSVTATQEEDGQTIGFYEQSVRGEVRCSFDPNDKLVAPTGPSLGEYSLLGDALDYTVRFQNTGNDTAFIVVIRDTLDPNGFDPASFEVRASSHPVRAELRPGGVLTFVFDDIKLLWQSLDDVASQGFVQYRIRPRAGLPDSATVRNTANIYFDFNPAVVTNTTANVLVAALPAVAVSTPESRVNDWQASPNPATTVVRIQAPGLPDGQMLTLRVLDSAGRIRQRWRLPNAGSVGLEGLEPGFYLLAPEGAWGKVKKLVVLR